MEYWLQTTTIYFIRAKEQYQPFFNEIVPFIYKSVKKDQNSWSWCVLLKQNLLYYI